METLGFVIFDLSVGLTHSRMCFTFSSELSLSISQLCFQCVFLSSIVLHYVSVLFQNGSFHISLYYLHFVHKCVPFNLKISDSYVSTVKTNRLNTDLIVCGLLNSSSEVPHLKN